MKAPLTLLLGIVPALVAGCEAPSRKEPAPPEAVTATRPPPARSARKVLAPAETVYTENYMVYTVKWGRAEDVAESLDPVLKSRYGPEARVVPHIPSNKLFIYIPPQNPAARTRTANPPPTQAVR